jgi:hypothetical protein
MGVGPSYLLPLSLTPKVTKLLVLKVGEKGRKTETKKDIKPFKALCSSTPAA